MKKRILAIVAFTFIVLAFAFTVAYTIRHRPVTGTISMHDMTDAQTVTVNTGLRGSYDVYLSPTSVQGYGLLLGDYTCEVKNINPDGTFQIRALIQSYDERGETPVHYTGGSMVVNWIAIPK